MLKRIVLTTSGVGKTYLDNICDNVYDFDKHTLSCKYHRELVPYLTDEEFKGMPGRIVNSKFPNNLFKMFDDFIKKESNHYDVVLGWGSSLYNDFVISNNNIGDGVAKELVTYELHGCDINVLNKRYKNRGNIFYKSLGEGDVNRVANKIRNNEYKGLLCWILKKPFYLKDFLVLTGSELVVSGNVYGIKEYLIDNGFMVDDKDIEIIKNQLTLDVFANSDFGFANIKNKNLCDFLRYRTSNIELVRN